MGIKERRKREKEELRTAILRAAMEIIAGKGHENLTIRDVAARIEYSSRTIYLYFENKETLMNAVTEAGFRATLGRRREQGDESVLSPAELLEVQIRGHVAMALSKPNLYRAIVAVVSARGHRPGEAETAVVARTGKVIAALAADRRPSAEEVGLLVDMVLGSVRAVTLQLLDRVEGLSDQEREVFVKEMVRFLVEGVRGRV